MKYILIGDPHTLSTSLSEAWRLFDFAADKAKEFEISTIIVMGDMFDGHYNVNSFVLNFYFQLFNKYKNINWICLVGNHDHGLHDRHSHALVGFKSLSNVTVVDDLVHFQDFDAIPYCSNEEFLEFCQRRRHDTLLAHVEVNGCMFENGFYSKNGIDLNLISYKHIISGHIHQIQKFGKIRYVGAPRWLSKGDANEQRGIWSWNGKDEFEFFSTEDVVGKIIEININEFTELPNLTSSNYKQVILKVTGKPKFIQEISEKYLGQAEIIPTIEDEEQSQVSEALGVNAALKKFILNDYVIQHSALNNQQLLENIINGLNSI